MAGDPDQFRDVQDVLHFTANFVQERYDREVKLPSIAMVFQKPEQATEFYMLKLSTTPFEWVSVSGNEALAQHILVHVRDDEELVRLFNLLQDSAFTPAACLAFLYTLLLGNRGVHFHNGHHLLRYLVFPEMIGLEIVKDRWLKLVLVAGGSTIVIGATLGILSGNISLADPLYGAWHGLMQLVSHLGHYWHQLPSLVIEFGNYRFPQPPVFGLEQGVDPGVVMQAFMPVPLMISELLPASPVADDRRADEMPQDTSVAKTSDAVGLSLGVVTQLQQLFDPSNFKVMSPEEKFLYGPCMLPLEATCEPQGTFICLEDFI